MDKRKFEFTLSVVYTVAFILGKWSNTAAACYQSGKDLAKQTVEDFKDALEEK